MFDSSGMEPPKSKLRNEPGPLTVLVSRALRRPQRVFIIARLSGIVWRTGSWQFPYKCIDIRVHMAWPYGRSLSHPFSIQMGVWAYPEYTKLSDQRLELIPSNTTPMRAWQLSRNL